MARSATLSKRENKIGVSRMSSVLGGSGLGGDDLDGGADELLVATIVAISPMLGCNLVGASSGVISSVLGCDETGAIWG